MYEMILRHKDKIIFVKEFSTDIFISDFEIEFNDTKINKSKMY